MNRQTKKENTATPDSYRSRNDPSQLWSVSLDLSFDLYGKLNDLKVHIDLVHHPQV